MNDTIAATNHSFIKYYIQKLFLTALLQAVMLLKKFAVTGKFLALALLTPFLFVWKIAFRPLVLVLYKVYIILKQRSGQYFHAQHKLLAVITHRFAIHSVVVILAFTVVGSNLWQAREVRAQEFAQDSLMAKIFQPDEETVITAQTKVATNNSYLDTSASVKIRPQLEMDTDLAAANDANAVMVAEGGSALVKANTLGNEVSTRSEIIRYTVQPGDTASTIAELFGVSTKTVLWSNDLTDSSLIKPGDELYVLPTSGVAHTVKSGETVTSIAQKYEASVDEILEFNKLISGEDLAAGTEIIIPGGTQPAPPPPVNTGSSTRLASIRNVFGGGTPAPSAAAVSGKMNWPTTCSRISQYFVWRHTGIDIDCEFGNAIYAAEGGTVAAANWYGGYGLQIVLNNGGGVQTRYAHLQKVFVTVGQTVAKGQTIGEMGSTGRSTGAHLHFEVLINGRATNPFNYL